jgi:hypothetical protein
MPVGLQLAGVPPVPLNVTVLAPCVTPKFAPVIVTEAPMVADVVDKLVMLGVGNTMNGTPLLAKPPTVTTTFPVVAPLGTGTTMLVALQLVGAPAVPLNATVLVPCLEPKFTPVTVTVVPTTPDADDRPAMLAAADTVNGTPLLATPPTVTTTFPVVDPVGTSTTMLVALQFTGVPAVPLNVTVLVPCVEPKFAPAMVMEAFGTATFGDKFVMEGPRMYGLKLAATLSKVAVASDEVLPLFTTSPTSTFCAMLTVWLPTCVQFAPSGDA